MKSYKLSVLVGVLGLSLSGLTALAQMGGDPPSTDPNGRPRMDLLARPLPDLPADLKQKMEEARAAVKAFRDAQAELMQKLRDATADQRQAIREDLKALRDAFREAQKAREHDIAQEFRAMRDKFKAERQGLIDAAKEKGRKRGGG